MEESKGERLRGKDRKGSRDVYRGERRPNMESIKIGEANHRHERKEGAGQKRMGV